MVAAAKGSAARTHHVTPRLVAIGLDDPLDDADFRRMFRRARRALARQGWIHLDQHRLRQLKGYKRWTSQAGFRGDGGGQWEPGVANLVAQQRARLEGRGITLRGVVVTGTFVTGQQLLTVNTLMHAPAPVTRRCLRSLHTAIPAQSVEVVVIHDPEPIAAASAYQAFTAAGGSLDPDVCRRLWARRGDFDWGARGEELRSLAGIDAFVAIDRPRAPGVDAIRSVLGQIDPAFDSAFEPYEDQSAMRLRAPGTHLLARIHRHVPGKRRNSAWDFLVENYGTVERDSFDDSQRDATG